MTGTRSELEEALGYTFTSSQLLTLALTHSSLAKSRADRDQTNQRLEFLGDRVLGLVVAGMIYETFPDEEEGAMARRHTALVRKEALARIAKDLALGKYILMATSEEDSGGRDNEALLADTCEAIIAALFMDGGLGTAETFIRAHWSALMSQDLTPPKDAKTTLQEYVQSRGMNLPKYRESHREGPPHDPVFTIEVIIDSGEVMTGMGGSKRQAEQVAASAMLEHLNISEKDTQ